MQVYKREFSVKANSSTLEPDRQQHDRLRYVCIAQQYSSATFVAARFHSHMEKNPLRFSKTLFRFLTF